METIKLNMDLKKSTKGTHVYGQVGVDQALMTIPSVYVRRTALPSPPPQSLVILIAMPEEGEAA